MRVGGTCAGAWYKAGTVQTARLSGGLTLIGARPLSVTHRPAVLDAQGLGRVMLVASANASYAVSNVELKGGTGAGWPTAAAC